MPTAAGPGSFVAPSASPPLAANVSYSDLGGQWNCGQGHETFVFFGNITGGVVPYLYNWTFGDGTPASSTATPTHTFSRFGQFIVNVSVEDAAGHWLNASVGPNWAISDACVGSTTDLGPLGVFGVALYVALVLAIDPRGCPPPSGPTPTSAPAPRARGAERTDCGGSKAPLRGLAGGRSVAPGYGRTPEARTAVVGTARPEGVWNSARRRPTSPRSRTRPSAVRARIAARVRADPPLEDAPERTVALERGVPREPPNIDGFEPGDLEGLREPLWGPELEEPRPRWQSGIEPEGEQRFRYHLEGERILPPHRPGRSAAPSEDADRLGEGGLRAWEVEEAEVRDSQIKTPRGEGEVMSGPLDRVPLWQPRSGDLEHRPREVNSYDAAPADRGSEPRGAGPAGDVDHPIAWARVNKIQERLDRLARHPGNPLA